MRIFIKWTLHKLKSLIHQKIPLKKPNRETKTKRKYLQSTYEKNTFQKNSFAKQ